MEKEKNEKSFIEKRGVEILVYAGAGACMIVGGVLGWKICKAVTFRNGVLVSQDGMVKLLRDASYKYGNADIFTAAASDGMKAAELGELGVEIAKHAGTENIKFTHFIAIGKE